MIFTFIHSQVTRETVASIMRNEDAVGVQRRSLRRFQRRRFWSPGPNYVWSIDGFDKLKPFGFAIHGAICGFSRRILWLEVGSTNNDPRIIANYFLNYVDEVQGCPTILRTDCGTENANVAFIQSTLREHHGDAFSGAASHQYGRSVSNQRIECWWSYFRIHRVNFLINMFYDLSNEGHLQIGNALHIGILRFAFMYLIKKLLREVKQWWNTHRIRANRQHSQLTGIPDVMYFTPETVLPDARDCKFPADPQTVLAARQFCTVPDSISGNLDLEEYLSGAMQRFNLNYPTTWREGIALYLELKDICLNGR